MVIESPPVHPSHRQLQAAFYVARLLKPGGEPRNVLERSYRSLATGALHDHVSLADGELLLLRAGLLTATDGFVVPTDALVRMMALPLEPFVETLLFRILTSQRPVWLAQLSTSDEVSWELVPYDVASALASTYEDIRERDALLLAAARKLDLEVLHQFGDEGELAVLTACREHLATAGLHHMIEDVAHVSLVDDTLGYDIATPDAAGRRHRLEVKATAAPPGWVEFFISRNEATVGQRDPRWSLVVTRREQPAGSADKIMHVAGWLTYGDFASALPTDPRPDDGRMRGRWASCRVTMSAARLRPGLPLQRPVGAW